MPKVLKLLSLLSFSAMTLLANSYAQEATEASNTRLVKIATLDSIEANEDFQRNVQVMQATRTFAIRLNEAIEKETDATKKKELQAKLDETIAQLNENNKKMVNAYGFSLNRNYKMAVEKSHIYMFVTEEEEQVIKKAQTKQ